MNSHSIDFRAVAVRPAGTYFFSVSRRRMMSVFFDRLSVFFRPPGACLFFVRRIHWIAFGVKYSFYLADYSGLACRPADINLLVSVFLVPERLQSFAR